MQMTYSSESEREFEKHVDAVLTTLRFFAVGCYQSAVGRDISNTMSQPSISRCINLVAKAICDQLLRILMKFPMTQHERQSDRLKFENSTHPFPGAIGAIDCTHVAMIAPNRHQEDYLNHHGYHSTNGDSGYPLEPWLMMPILHAEQVSPQECYTAVHVSAKNVVDRCFGLLKMRWHCLSDQRILMYKPETAAFIITACAVLHNICIDRRLPLDEIEEEQPHVIRPLQASIA